MDTESPAQRLTRRIGAAPDHPTAADDPDDESDTALARWLPEPAAPRRPAELLAAVRADPGRAGVLALLGVGVIAVLVTVFTVARSPDQPVTAANLPPVQMVSTAAAPTSAAADGPVVVSVVGLVHKPGLVTVAAGDRIADALEQAGGALDGADLVGLNLARRVVDGEQIIVGITAPPGAPAPMGSSVSSPGGTTAAPGGPAEPAATVNLNTADAEALDALPGVGPVTATAIIAWRDANGPFTHVDELGEVDGIGPARLDKLRALVGV